MTEVHGFVGNFDVTIKKKARYVNENICTGCGACTEKCPMRKVPNEFNLGMDNRSAIYIPFAQAIPKVATIDPEHCMMLKSGKCGLCSKVCTAGAIDYKAKDEFITEKYGAIVAATGFNPISLEKFDEFAYSQSKDVVTSLEFERLMNAAGPTKGTLLRPSDGKHPKTIVLFNASVRAVRPVRIRARNIVRKSAACTQQNMRCSQGINILIRMFMFLH